MEQREQLGSRLGFILLSAGCAIGIGNVWKFPYMVGQYGGGAFVLIYLFFLVILGIPVMTMEFAMGRAGQRSPARLYQQLEPKGSKWHLHGYVAMAGNYILMMFYTSVAGWMLDYFVRTAGGQFVGADTDGVAAQFSQMLGDPLRMTLFMGIIVVLGFLVCSFSLQKGLERITKWMMVALLVIMVVLAINSVCTAGGSQGLRFYLVPDLARMKKVGIGNVVAGAMNQAFFTLSLGIGAMAIFGSYIGKERALMGESARVAALDTLVALCSGLIIFPACFAYGVQPDSGPSLIFITLPNIFNHMPLGRVWGSLFFVFMSFAAFSTVLGVFENIVSCTMDLSGWSRKKACLFNGILMLLLSMPCVLGFNVLSKFQPLGPGTGVLDLEDFVVSNLLLPLGSLIFIFFCTSRYGWGWKDFTKEANTGKGLKVQRWMRGYMCYVLPVLVAVILVLGLIRH
ncbi:MAG: sodium-dependent transporter [Acutalibacteraceae bacterium]|nr:sodium-dependent transporter [Clostridium sp.]MED9940237.1 sodium-dependent transporter [Acutalibacteraceae bacterium]PWM12474.1 MAG: sodium-dependent transporter [Clostridiales bacterium]UYI91022.1 MAG: sodium-dependent transporter [Oscillospiraceae bacterium]HCG33870.1 sodium-dependent transporter [Oscillospiraceae bacterium]